MIFKSTLLWGSRWPTLELKLYCLHTRKQCHFGQRHGLQSLILTSYFYKIFIAKLYIYTFLKVFSRQIYSYSSCIVF